MAKMSPNSTAGCPGRNSDGTAISASYDAATGTLRLKAEFANEDDLLFPNQFVNVRLHLQTLSNALTIPVDAVQFGSQGTYV